MVKTIIGTIMLCLACSLAVNAQSTAEIQQLMHINEQPAKAAPHWRGVEKNNSSEFDLLFSGLFLMYKTFFSSQDVSKCSFTPSCSVYALQAIKKQGPIVGMINFFDRFTRCNGLNADQYSVDPETHLLDDPVE